MEDVLNISAHKYGNYHKYYDFHPATTRTSMLDKEEDNIFFKMWKSQNEPKLFALLDVGCNEGDLSMDMYNLAIKQLPPSVTVALLGIDLDSSLIELADKKYASISKETISFMCVNCMEQESTDQCIKNYFNHLRQTVSVEFTEGFSFVSLFSITMWIHLNHNDEGLIRFLELGAKYLTPLGTLLVEPQPWKCYKSAVKRTRKLGLARPLYYDTIKIRNNIEEEVVRLVMQSEGSRFCSHSSLGKEVWGRSLLLFHRSDCEVTINNRSNNNNNNEANSTNRGETIDNNDNDNDSKGLDSGGEHVNKKSKC